MKEKLATKVVELRTRQAKYEEIDLRVRLPGELVALVDNVWAERGNGAVLQVLRALKPLGRHDRERIAHWALAELEGLDREACR